MMMGAEPNLPTELWRISLSYLDPPSLIRCQRVSKAWQTMACDDSVWRSMALKLGYIPPETIQAQDLNEPPKDLRLCSNTHAYTNDYDDLDRTQTQAYGEQKVDYPGLLQRASASGYYEDLGSFEDLCIRRWKLDQKWCSSPPEGPKANLEGALRPRCDFVGIEPIEHFRAQRRLINGEEPVLDREEMAADVFRFKIDHIDRTLIATTQFNGGVRVYCLDTKSLLWKMPGPGIRPYSHIEFDRGYVIAESINGRNFEVWQAQRLSPSGGPRGHFVHYATIVPPRATRALRFQYPYLVIATLDHHLLTWDITRKTFTQEVVLQDFDNVVTYIDFDDEFIFVCGMGGKNFKVLSRKEGREIWSLAKHLEAGLGLPTTYIQGPKDKRSEFGLARERIYERQGKSAWQEAPSHEIFGLDEDSTIAWGKMWLAVHPDHRTNTLVILGGKDILLIHDYKVMFRAWEKLSCGEPPGKACSPTLFVDIFQGHDERPGEVADDFEELDIDEISGLLAVADGRAFCVYSSQVQDDIVLIDLDPDRQQTSQIPCKGTNVHNDRSMKETAGSLSNDKDAFAVYTTKTIELPSDDRNDVSYYAWIEYTRCVQMDGTTVYCSCVLEGKRGQAFSVAALEFSLLSKLTY